jgi:hypothetical protein
MHEVPLEQSCTPFKNSWIRACYVTFYYIFYKSNIYASTTSSVFISQYVETRNRFIFLY